MPDNKQVMKQHILLRVRKGEGIIEPFLSDKCESYSGDRWTCCIIGKCYDTVYNRVNAKVLCQELERHGEINLLGYQGMFALVYFDAVRVCFTVDPIGMYRLYFYFSNDELVIAEHTEDIVDAVSDNFHIDYQAWSEFLYFSYVLGDRTFFKEIKTVHPESIMICNIREWKLYTQIFEGYSAIEENEKLSFDEVVEQSIKLLNVAITGILNRGRYERIICPISGGYDSRCLAGLLRKQNIDNVETYTGDFDEGSQADKVYGRTVAEFLHYPNTLIQLEDSYFELEIEQYLYDVNYESVENLPFWNYSKLMEVENNAILFDGYAGDRLLRTRISRSDYDGEELFFEACFTKNGNQNIKMLCDSKNWAYVQYLAKKGMREELNRCKGNMVIYYLFNRNHRNMAYNPAHLDCVLDVYTPYTNPGFLKFALTIPESIKVGNRLYCLILNRIIDGLGDIPSTNDIGGGVENYNGTAYKNE